LVLLAFWKSITIFVPSIYTVNEVINEPAGIT
jgi:hypothetical protein